MRQEVAPLHRAGSASTACSKVKVGGGGDHRELPPSRICLHCLQQSSRGVAKGSREAVRQILLPTVGSAQQCTREQATR